jgi:hypothetical protein
MKDDRPDGGSRWNMIRSLSDRSLKKGSDHSSIKKASEHDDPNLMEGQSNMTDMTPHYSPPQSRQTRKTSSGTLTLETIYSAEFSSDMMAASDRSDFNIKKSNEFPIPEESASEENDDEIFIVDESASDDSSDDPECALGTRLPNVPVLGGLSGVPVLEESSSDTDLIEDDDMDTDNGDDDGSRSETSTVDA